MDAPFGLEPHALSTFQLDVRVLKAADSIDGRMRTQRILCIPETVRAADDPKPKEVSADTEKSEDKGRCNHADQHDLDKEARQILRTHRGKEPGPPWPVIRWRMPNGRTSRGGLPPGTERRFCNPTTEARLLR